MYRKLYSKIMSSTMILCMIVTLFIPSCNVKAADIAMEYTSYEVLQWILMELGLSVSLKPEEYKYILPDGQEITKPNLGAELIREVNDSIELWWSSNQMDDVVDGYDGGFEQFKSDFADMLEWGKDGVIEITEDTWSILRSWGKSLNQYISETLVEDSFYIDALGSNSFTLNGKLSWGVDWSQRYNFSNVSSPVYMFAMWTQGGKYLDVFAASMADFNGECVDGSFSYNMGGYFSDGIYVKVGSSWEKGSALYNIPIVPGVYDTSSECVAVLSRILHGDFSDFTKDVIWQDTDLKSDICGIPWELPDSVPYPHSGDATITIPQDLPIDDAITGVGTGELTWEDVIGKTFPIPIDKPIDKPAEGDTETDTEKDTEEETESEKEIEWDDTIFAPDGAIGGKLSELSKKFPFCIPFDVVALFKGVGKDVVETAPRWKVSIDMPFIDYTWIVDIDMKDYEKYVKIFRDGFYLLFLVGLFFTTRKLISWQID